LDALCKRYGIDNSQRTKHGALMDSVLLAEVYIELLGVRQAALGLAMDGEALAGTEARAAAKGRAAQRPQPLPSRVTADMEAAHRAFVETLGPKALWLRYLAVTAATDASES
jgi:DNA polymerase-3 subunit epsilon